MAQRADYPVPGNESERLNALRSLKILDTPADERFDRIVRIARDHYQMPVVRVTLVDEDRVWFKARLGIKADQAPRSISLCSHTIMSSEPLLVPDLTADLRFSESPQVMGKPYFRFYAAAPISVEGGHNIGSVCLMDYEAHPDFTVEDTAFLQDLSDIVVDELKLHEKLTKQETLIDSYVESLQQSEERFSLAMRGANDGLWDWNLRTDEMYYSPRWCRMLGYEPEEIAPQRESWSNLVDPADKYRVLDMVEKWISGRADSLETEYRMRHKDGDWRTIWTRAFLAREDGQPVRIVGTHVDITERRQLEEQIRQAQKMEAVGQLTGGVAHDFNNLLGVMLGNAEQASILLSQEGSNAQARIHIGEVVRAVNRSAALTQRLLSFSRRQTLVPKTTDIGVLIRNFEDMLRRAIGETVELTADLGDDVWPAMVDGHQLENALLNLTINARDAMSAGGCLTVTTGNTVLGEAEVGQHGSLVPGDYVKVTVSDTGDGIAPEILDRVMEPFFTTKGVGEGSGLGLSMVFGFAKQSKGHLAISSEVGSGTVVELYLPRSLGIPQATTTASHISERTEPLSARILVVEDDPDLREIPVQILRKHGFEVVEAANGSQALAALKATEDFDLLFSDVVLPGGMNGVAIADEARRLQPAIKVLLTSGYNSGAIADQVAGADTVKVLSKPYSRNDLLESVCGLLDVPAD